MKWIKAHHYSYRKYRLYYPWFRKGPFTQKRKQNMNYESRLMRFVPAGVVLAAAVFLGLAPEKVRDFDRIDACFGYAAVIALLALAVFDYRIRLRKQGNR